MSDEATIWRELRQLRDVKMTTSMLLELPTIESSQRRNVKKQAEQVSATLAQAEEYFEAAQSASLATSPNLAYYGSVSLTKALYLLTLNGEFSLDYLRKKNRHAHHGLNIERSKLGQLQNCDDPVSFLKSVSARQHTNSGQAWGHFALLNKCLFEVSHTISVREPGQSIEGLDFNYTELKSPPPAANLSSDLNRNLSAFELLSYIPDMYSYSNLFKQDPQLFRGSISAVVTPKLQAPSTLKHKLVEFFSSVPSHKGPASISTLTIRDIDQDHIDELLSRYSKANDIIHVVDQNIDPNSLMFMLFQLHPAGKRPVLFGPTFPETMSSEKGDILFIRNPVKRINELAAIHATLYLLSILCRYYPDIWSQVTSQSYFLAEILRYFVRLTLTRVPFLVLNTFSSSYRSSLERNR